MAPSGGPVLERLCLLLSGRGALPARGQIRTHRQPASSPAKKESNGIAFQARQGGVIGLTKSLGKELATSGVLVNCITPAVIVTDTSKQLTQQHVDYMLSKIPMGALGRSRKRPPGGVA